MLTTSRADMMDLEELRAFLAVAETGSLLGAATSLAVSRTTLRRRVEGLEARAGVPLLDRTQQGISLTPAGEVLARKGREMMAEASTLLAAIREAGTAPSAPLRLALPVGMPPQAMVPWLRTLRQRFSSLRLHVRFVDDPARHLEDDVDIAIHFGERPHGPWVSREIKRMREWLIASRDYLDARGTPRDVEELAAHPLLCWQSPGEDARALPLARGGHAAVKPVMVATDIHLLRQCAAGGLGIALVPDAMLPDSAQKLVPILQDLVGRDRVMHATVPRMLADLPHIRAVLDHTHRRWSKDPGSRART